MAAKLLGLRSVTVLNQMMLISSPSTPRTLARLLAAGSITIGEEFWDLSDRILFPDLPRPFTISESNLWNSGRVGARADYIGFLSPPRSYPPDPETEKILAANEKMLFWQVSGPPRTRVHFLSRAREAAFAMQRRVPLDHLLREPARVEVAAGASRVVTSTTGVSRGTRSSTDATRSSPGPVTSPYRTSSSAGKPSVLVPIAAQSEQIGNAAKAQRLGVAAHIPEEKFSTGELRAALAGLDSDETARRCADLSAYARGFDAAGAVVGALME